MDKALLERTVGTIVSNYPQIIPHLSDDVFAVLCKHYGPGEHPGTGTPQSVHGGDGGVYGSYNDLPKQDNPLGLGKGYWVTANRHVMSAEKDHNVAIANTTDPDILGISQDELDVIHGAIQVTDRQNFDVLDGDAWVSGLQNIYNAGNVQVREGMDGRSTNLTTGSINTETLRLLQGYADDGLLYISKDRNVWASSQSGRVIEFTEEEFYNARRVVSIGGVWSLKSDGTAYLSLKTVDYFNATLARMVRNVYTNNMGGEFVDILGALIRGQMRDAYNRAYAEAGFSDAPPDWLQADLEAMQAEQANFDYIYSYYQAIVDARVDGRPLQPLLDRVPMWVNRWREAHSRANMTITTQLGGRLMWKEGDTIEKCETCVGLDGIVAFASEWELSGFRPQGSNLICGGWQCQCTLEPTDRRRSPNAWDRIMAVASA